MLKPGALVVAAAVLLVALIVVGVTPPTGAQAPAAPKIEISQPAEAARIDAGQVMIVATVSDDTGIANIVLRVNGERVPFTPPKDAPPRATVNMSVPLVPGENVIGITATNKGGRIAQAVRTVNRPAPSVAAPAPAKPAAPPKPKHEWYAVVIGISQYEDSHINKVQFAENDARAVADFLVKKAGYKPENVLLVTDTTAQKPTLANMKRALDDVRRRARKDDTVFVYYSGHGAPEVDAAGKHADGLDKYLVPRDADSGSLFSTALSMDNLYQIFQRLQAERVVIALDTSFSGRASARSFSRQATRSGLVSPEFLERLGRAKGRVLLTATSASQVALEMPEQKHGLFTWVMLQGLAGGADNDRDGVVTINELFSYLQQHVPARARQMNEAQSPGMDGSLGDLPFVQVQK